MTAEFTQSIQISPSNLMADTVSAKPDYTNMDDGAFSSALDNASKSYMDKTENKTDNISDKKDYSQKTKDIKESQKDYHTENETSSEKVQPKEEDNYQVKDDKTTDKTVQDNDDSVKENAPADKASQNKNKNENNNEISSENEVDENTEDIQKTNKPEIGASALKAVEQLLENIQNNTAVISDTVEQTVSVQNQPKTEAVKTTDTVQNTNSIANEQILANIEYSDEAELFEKLQTIKNLDPEELKKLIETAKNSSANAETAPVQTNAANNTVLQKTVEDSLKNIAHEVSAEDIEVKTETNTNTNTNTQKTTTDNINNAQTLNLKTAKENLAADTSRLTANIEQAAEQPVEQTQAKPVTPSDTKSQEAPTIKVTQEVASQVKENVSANIENKDTTSKVKDKAVQTMIALQDTDTTVTESKIANNNNTKNNSSMNQNMTNAGETAVKLSVDQSAVNQNQITGAETFVNKLDAQLNSMKNASNQAKTLNQSDIMSQVSSKFEQLQQSGNNKVSIVLQPESLGKVSVEIMNSKDGIVAKMTTDSQQVKELFDKNVEALKSNLSSQGVNVNNIKVECSQESSNNAMNFEREQFNQSFENRQNGQNQANHSNKDTQTYTSDYSTSSETEAEAEEGREIKNTQTIIKHNGKVDYTV